MYPVLLFDMDGTLVDSAEGVYQSMRYAMEAEGVPPIKREQARYFLGETLESVLKRKFGMEGPVVQRIRERFLPHYQDTGLFATTPVPGMVELTRALHEKGYRLGIASCKPWIYCGPTLQHCGFSDFFEAIAGSWHNGVPEEKTAVIREALRLLDVPAGQAVMIGDRGGGYFLRSFPGNPWHRLKLLRLWGARGVGTGRRCGSSPHGGSLGPDHRRTSMGPFGQIKGDKQWN